MKILQMRFLAILVALSVFGFSFPVYANQSPSGSLDGANCDIIGGWAYDPDTPNGSIAIHFYELLDNGSLKFLDDSSTSGNRSDVNSILGISGNHGFTISTPVSIKDGQPHDIYAYGIDSDPSHSMNALLSGSPKTIQCAAPSTPTPAPTSTPPAPTPGVCEHAAPPARCHYEGADTYPSCEVYLVCPTPEPAETSRPTWTNPPEETYEPTEVTPTPSATPTPIFNAADINQDGRVDRADYNTLLANFGRIGPNQADLNGDRIVDIFDHNELVENYDG